MTILRDSLVFPILAVSLAATSLTAQSDWQLLSPSNPPPQRAWMGMAYDISRGVSVLAGGWRENVGTLDDTWEFDGVAWTQVPSAPLPAPRCCIDLAYITSTGRMLTFGGLTNSSSALGDTLEYDGTSWTTTAVTGPPPRSYATLAYDVGRDRVVAFGGADDTFTSCFADTWEYDPAAQTWSQITTPTTPPARAEPGLAYDLTRGVVVMYGGWDLATAGTLGDTWEYDGVDWTQVTTPVSPPPRTECNMVYDTLRDRTVMHGGIDYNFTTTFNDTWEYDGSTWVQLTPNNPGPGVAAPGMTHHFTTGQTFAFGGTDQNNNDNSDTWRFESVNPPAVQVVPGAGCPTSAGVPPLSVTPLPWTGDTVNLTIDTVPAGGLQFLVWDFSSATTSLAPFGYPACAVINQAAVQFTTGPVAFAIPAWPFLAGTQLSAQGAVIEPVGSTFGLGLTNVTTLTLGVR